MSVRPSLVWLVGAHGMLASALRARYERHGITCLLTDRELDVSSREQVLSFAREECPEQIVNAAGYTRVDDAEAHEADARRTNGDGPANLAEAAALLGVPFLHFSTDYVFDGRASVAYTEDAPTAPLGVYGRSKLEGEERALATSASNAGGVYVLRTSWLFGENGPNFVKTMVGLLRDRDELRVVNDQHGRPTYTGDLADAALGLLGVGRSSAAPPGLYHFANAGATTWHGFVVGIRAACERLGLPVRASRIEPVSTSEFPRPAPRPAYSVLDTSRIEQALGQSPRAWPAALEDYLRREYAGGA